MEIARTIRRSYNDAHTVIARASGRSHLFDRVRYRSRRKRMIDDSDSQSSSG